MRTAEVTELSWPVGDARRFGEVDRPGVLALGESIGVPSRLGGRWLDELCGRIAMHADDLIAEAETRGFDAGELRLLRQIRFGPLLDALQRLHQARR